MTKLPKNTALILVDVQKGMDFPYWGPRNNPDAEENIGKLLTAFRNSGRAIIHIQHMSTEPQSPLRPGQIGNEFKEVATPLPNELVIQKSVNSAFIETNLDQVLQRQNIKVLVIAGITTNHCVSTTTRMAGNMGYEVYLSYDATHAFEFIGLDGNKISAQVMHDVGLAELHKEFATVVNTKEIIGWTN